MATRWGAASSAMWVTVSASSSCRQARWWGVGGGGGGGLLLGLFTSHPWTLSPQRMSWDAWKEARFNHNGSHDRSTNAAIQEWLPLKRSVFRCACASLALLSHEHPSDMEVIFLPGEDSCHGSVCLHSPAKPHVCSSTLWKNPELSGSDACDRIRRGFNT